MAFASRLAADRPLSEINTTPLIDVMLVLLVMLVVTIPVATHSIDVDVPRSVVPPVKPDTLRNRIALSRSGDLRWNGTAVSDAQLGALLAEVRAMSIQPQLEFEPAADASYARSAEILRLVKRVGIVNFGFVGNERFATFGT